MSRFSIYSVSRRAALSAFAATPVLAASARSAAADTAPGVAPRASCTLTPASVPGPFYFDPKLQRSDITEGQPGVPLRMRFVVMEAANCAPLPGARRQVFAVRYGDPPDPPAVTMLMDVLRSVAEPAG